jgi:DUF1365 family protein
VSPFNAVDGYYLVRAPEPGAELDVRVSLHRDNQPAFVVTMRGPRRRAGIAELLRLQVVAPLAPLAGALGIRVQGITLWLRRVPVVPRTETITADQYLTKRPEFDECPSRTPSFVPNPRRSPIP